MALILLKVLIIFIISSLEF